MTLKGLIGEIMETGRAGYFTILATLRREIRHRGRRIPELAKDLGVAEPTLWRWLRGKGLTLDALDRICGLLDLDMRELVALGEDQRTDQFTISQERVLAADRGLALLFFALLNGAKRDQCSRDFDLTESRIDSYLERLQRIGLIDLSPRGRIRHLTARSVRWRRGGPLTIAFEKTVKHLFLTMDFADADARYVTDMIRINDAGRARVHALFEALRVDMHVIAQQEQTDQFGTFEWSGVMMLIRALDLREMNRGLVTVEETAEEPHIRPH
jgi:transcriptional regulator with XRE-family HTH domain